MVNHVIGVYEKSRYNRSSTWYYFKAITENFLVTKIQIVQSRINKKRKGRI